MLAKFCFADGKCLINVGFHTFTIVYIGIYTITHNCSLQLLTWKLKLYYSLKCDLECLSLSSLLLGMFVLVCDKVISNFVYGMDIVTCFDAWCHPLGPFLCTYHVFMDALQLTFSIWHPDYHSAVIMNLVLSLSFFNPNSDYVIPRVLHLSLHGLGAIHDIRKHLCPDLS
jgi:hypothetical protein